MLLGRDVDFQRAAGLPAGACAVAVCLTRHRGVQEGKRAIGLQLQEPWLREHQVLPGRSHPTMSMQGTGGYLLTGTTIASQQ